MSKLQIVAYVAVAIAALLVSFGFGYAYKEHRAAVEAAK